MNDMTPEERLTKIENALQAVIETLARHENALEKQSALIERHDAMIDKQNVGIRDLITVSRSLLDTANAHTGLLAGLADAQKRTEENLKALIDTVRGHEGKIDALVDIVDRIIPRENLSS